MVAPSAFAETVTPPSLSPAGPAIAPDRIASAAWAGTSIVVVASAATRPASLTPARVIECLPVGLAVVLIGLAAFALGRRRRLGRARRHGPEIGRDGGDLRLAEVVLEARHARRAVGDDLAHAVLVAARRFAREHRGELRRGELRLEMAYAAGLHEQGLSELLGVVELGLLGRCTGGGQEHDG